MKKKRRRKLYTALADVESLAEARKLYEEGMSGMEEEAARYAEAVSVLENSGVRQDVLLREKSELYEQVAKINREIRAKRKQLKMCQAILEKAPKMERDIQRTESVRNRQKKRTRQQKQR